METLKQSIVAGIVNKSGGLRIVIITSPTDLVYHVNKEKGEKAYIIPNLEVLAPVSMEKAKDLIQIVQEYIRSQTGCGECTACCITPYFKTEGYEKPSGKPCKHCKVGVGCKIYEYRYPFCRQYECHWLKSQRTDNPMKPELRPDRCGVYFMDDSTNGDPLVFEMHVDPKRSNIDDNFHVVEYILQQRQNGFKDKLITYYYGEQKDGS